jgi:hypothetical protein
MVHWLSVYGRLLLLMPKLNLWSGTYLYSMQKHCRLLGLDLEFIYIHIPTHSPTQAMASSFMRFLDYSQHTAVSSTPLDK